MLVASIHFLLFPQCFQLFPIHSISISESHYVVLPTSDLSLDEELIQGNLNFSLLKAVSSNVKLGTFQPKLWGQVCTS